MKEINILLWNCLWKFIINYERERQNMRYEYTITKEGGEAEIMKEMSWKKLFKKLLLKYPQFSGWCTYINKKGHVQVRNFNNGKETKKL